MKLEEKIIEFISLHYRGNNNPVPASDIAESINLAGFSTTPEEVQRLIENIRREKMALIGSSSFGFFLIISDEDHAITQAYIRSRIGPIVKAADNLESMWKEKNGGTIQGVML